MTFGNRLRDARILRGWSLKEVEEKTGIIFNTLSNYETGKSKPKIDKIILLSNFYNVSLDYLFGLSESPNSKANYLPLDPFEGLYESQIEVINDIINHYKKTNLEKKKEKK